MACETAARAECFCSIQIHPALTIEVGCGFLLVEVIEDRLECIVAVEFQVLTIFLDIHVHDEARVFHEAAIQLFVSLKSEK